MRISELSAMTSDVCTCTEQQNPEKERLNGTTNCQHASVGVMVCDVSSSGAAWRGCVLGGEREARERCCCCVKSERRDRVTYLGRINGVTPRGATSPSQIKRV
eukprot:3939921-Rhodomonas_salina.1